MGPELMCRALAMADNNVSSDESGPTPEKRACTIIQEVSKIFDLIPTVYFMSNILVRGSS